MSESQDMRAAWDDWRCATGKFVRVTFWGESRSWNLHVADEAEEAFRALAATFEDFGYGFEEGAGGTYNCRTIGGSDKWSLHAYAIALDINPSVNRYGNPLRHNYPPGLIAAVEAIKTADGKQVFRWGGDWATPDAMHWQLRVTPDELENGLKTKEYRGVKNVPDVDWARTVVDNCIDEWGIINTTDDTPDDWLKVEPNDGRLWIMFNRALKKQHPL